MSIVQKFIRTALFLSLAMTLTACTAQNTASEVVDDEPGPAALRVVADDSLLNQKARIEEDFDRAQGAFEAIESLKIAYVPTAEIENEVRSESYDFVLALADTVNDLRDGAGLVGSNKDGTGQLNTCNINTLNRSKLVVARAKGSSTQLPETGRLDSGENLERLALLGKAKGKIAVPDESTLQGRSTNIALFQAGLYSSESGTGGKYDDALDGKIVMASSADEALDLVADGTCKLGFAYNHDVNLRDDVEIANGTTTGLKTPSYKCGVIKSSRHKAATRGFMNWWAQLL